MILPFCSSCTPPGGKVTENKTHRMINTEEKAKVVAAVWETEFIQIPGGASYFAQRRVEE